MHDPNGTPCNGLSPPSPAKNSSMSHSTACSTALASCGAAAMTRTVAPISATQPGFRWWMGCRVERAGGEGGEIGKQGRSFRTGGRRAKYLCWQQWHLCQRHFALLWSQCKLCAAAEHSPSVCAHPCPSTTHLQQESNDDAKGHVGTHPEQAPVGDSVLADQPEGGRGAAVAAAAAARTASMSDMPMHVCPRGKGGWCIMHSKSIFKLCVQPCHDCTSA